MPSNKKQHYVPRFYLKNFALDGQSLSLYNFGGNRLVPTANLKNQCYRAYMYGKDGKQEQNLARLEEALSGFMKQLITSQTPPPQFTYSHELLCMLAILQHSRTAYTADAANEFLDKIVKAIFEKDPELVDLKRQGVRIEHKNAAAFALSTIFPRFHLIGDLSYRCWRSSNIDHLCSSKFDQGLGPPVLGVGCG